MSFVSQSPSRVMAALAVAALVTGTALAFGPRAIAAPTENTGEPALSSRLEASLPSGARNTSVVDLSADGVDFAGLGADEFAEYEIGSITKTFTAELLRQEIEKGTVTLGSTVGEFLEVGDASVGTVTLGELATHTSGLTRSPGTDLVRTLTGGNPYVGITPQRLVELAENDNLSGRGEVNYSNLGVALLGQILAAINETTYSNLLSEHILIPLGMEDTHIIVPGSDAELTTGLRLNGRPAEAWVMDGYAPAGAIRSTAADMALWARYMLETGVPEYTWVHEDDGTVWHNGTTGGFSSMLILDPDSDSAVFAVTDTTVGMEKTASEILKGQGK